MVVVVVVMLMEEDGQFLGRVVMTWVENVISLFLCSVCVCVRAVD